MGRIIEAKAVISGEDRLSKVLDGIARKFRDVGKGARVAADVGRLGKELEAANRGLRDIERFRSTHNTFAQARSAYRGAQAEIARIGRDLDAARKAAQAFDGIRSFSKTGGIAQQMTAARRSVSELERQFVSAQRAVKASAASFDSQAAAMKGVRAELAGSGLNVGRLVAEQGRLKGAIDATTAAILRQERAQQAESRLASGMSESGRRTAARLAQGRYLTEGMSASGRAATGVATQEAEDRRQRRVERREALKSLAGAGGVYLGHKVHEGTRATLHTYREFDKERRFGKAVMGLTDEEQRPLVDQAVHMGATTRYNDVQVLEAQRELAARGLKRDQVIGLMGPAANLGQALDLALPDAVKQMEGALFGFKKPMETLAEAQASANQTADVQVKAAKISGMTPEDIRQTYKYGATPARMAGLSEETLLAFAGISKKANMGGDEAGTAFRALVANAMSPTRGAKEAMLANGMDYKNYQRMPEAIDTKAFTKTVAAQYGVKLDQATQDSLEKIFTNKAMVADPSTFTPAVLRLLSDNLGGDDAKSKKSIAGLANRFRDKSMQGVDADRLVSDLMTQIPKNPALANAIFGSKQGSRIQNALGDPTTFKHLLEELVGHRDGFAKKVSDERNAGFDGAMSRLEGSIKNLETAAGRAWDDDGKGGFLLGLADSAAKATQALAELPRPVLQVGTALGYIGGKVASATGTLALFGAALSLKGSAAALTAAAARLGVAGVAGAVPGGAAAAAGGGLAATLGLPALIAAGGAGAAFAGYATSQAMPKLAAAKGAGGIDYGTGGALDESPMAGMAPARPFVQDWWRSTMPSWLGGGSGSPIPVEVKALPSGADASGQAKALGNTLDAATSAASTAANGGRPIEATVKPDQITAKVETLPPITGEATVTVENHTDVRVTLNTDMLDAKVNAAAGRAVAKLPLSSGGRAGATSMPGAAATPGAK